MTAFRDTIVSFIAAMQGEPPFLMVSRYAGFNYLQDLSTNTPLYGASYSYGQWRAPAAGRQPDLWFDGPDYQVLSQCRRAQL
jgi:hypothetical protein